MNWLAGVLPSDVDTRPPTRDELGRFLARRALAAHGVLREIDIRDHIRGPRGCAIEGLAQLLDSGEVIPVHIEGEDPFEYYALSTNLENVCDLPIPSDRVFLLSPFDNLIIQQD